MDEAKKCPKCGGELVEAARLVAHTRVLANVSLAKKGDLLGDTIVPYYCRKCGYIEFYKKLTPGEQPQPQGFLKNCTNCGKQIPIASEECQYCGAKQMEEISHE